VADRPSAPSKVGLKMDHSAKAYSALIYLISAMATPALAQQPPDLVTSDSLANTAMGSNALLNVNLSENGCHNTASGENALYSDTGGSYNTATGFNSLYSNTTGDNNTAAGYESLYSNSTGTNNTGIGYQALYANTTGNGNTADGFSALAANTTGNYNSAFGYQAFATNTTGSYTTAVGSYALGANTTGGYDTAFGAYSLPANTSGTGNTAFGYAALRSTTTGNSNIGFGYQALYLDTAGSNNIAMGYQAAYFVTGSNTIEIGTEGAAGDNDVTRIGTPGTQKAAYVAGISGAQVTGSAVYVTSSGQLGVLASSERYKTAIAPIGTDTERLQELRPVSFHLKTDPKGPVQYGLIAEEVNDVYPELVIRDDKGKIQGVRYEELTPMLLNEMQQQHKAMTEKLDAQAAEIRDLKKLVVEMQTGLLKLQAKDELVAQR
jgi:trimeric autotransporter adhesin